MLDSKTINTVTKFYNIIETTHKLGTPETSEDDKFFVCNIGVELAKSTIQEFGEKEAIKMAKIILSITG